ncbi:hypothetical protein [Stenotrophomonas sp. 278]|uniref:hypothetical protein n=1 Tax=Stenotrophomonas sp. 278 TaxID=2479851 RepID=UPI000F68DC36|nr:hypothetical protein [Stenotrophomonas sp. 278]RRU19368.1 hypothetical protein EGJ34_05825 [Stenotrophomonas sp. 278]
MRKSIIEQLTLRHSGCSWHQPKKVRISRLRIPAQGYKAGVDVPSMMLQGMWLYSWEFESGGWVTVKASRGKLVLEVDHEARRKAAWFRKHGSMKGWKRRRRGIWGVISAVVRWWRR